jgi:TolB-like protein/Tfp pilus assembly protein PilF
MTENHGTPPSSPELTDEAILAELERILASPEFAQSDSLKSFLRYIVERTVQGQAGELKEYNVGVEVLDRGESFDPRIDTIVRVQATRLRSKLTEYYQSGGRDDPVRIELPKGSYVPAFRKKQRLGSDADRRLPSRHHALLPWGVGLILAGVAVYWLSAPKQPEPATRSVAIGSIAVLPFTDMSPQKDQEYLGDGIAEELTNTLAQLQGVYVVPRTTAFQFKDQPQDIQKIGQQLQVDTVLQGSVRKSGERLRVTTQLIRTRDGDHLWSQTYERQADEVFEVEQEISRSIANALRVQLLSRPDDSVVDKYTRDHELYELYLKGRYYLNRQTLPDIIQAIAFFNQVLSRDPQYAPAYAGLADSYAHLAAVGFVPPPEIDARAKSAAEKVLEIDSNLVDAQLSLAAYRILFEWDWHQGERALRRAIQLDPNSSRAHDLYGRFLAATGRLDESLTEAKRAVELDKLSLSAHEGLARALYCRRDYQAALIECQKVLEWAPDSYSTQVILGLALKQQSKFEEAVAAFRKLDRASGTETPLAASLLAHTYALSGRDEEALRYLHRLRDLSELEYVAPSYFARAYLGFGDKEAALEWLERGYQDRSVPVAVLKIDPDLDPLRTEPRFQTLLKNVGLD